MMEYVFFDFFPFGIDKKVSSLTYLLDFIHEQDQVSPFSEFQLCIAKDIANGLSFLHSHSVVHRDLKPDNILVTNQHYTQMTDEEQRLEFSRRPVRAKLTDFGESRASCAQTQTLIKSKTDWSWNVGIHASWNSFSGIYWIQSRRHEEGRYLELWYDFVLFNESRSWPPYVDHHISAYDCSKTDQPLTQDFLLKFMKEKKLPESDPTYKCLRIVDWWQMEETCNATLKFEMNWTWIVSCRKSTRGILAYFPALGQPV